MLVFGSTSATGTLTLSGGAIAGPSSVGTIELVTGGNESIGSGTSFTATSSKNLVLATGGTFINSGGSSALAASGGSTWQTWSQVQANDSLNGLQYGFKQYDATFGSSSVLGTGNGYLLTEAPTVLIGLASASKVYDGTTNASPTFSTTPSISGLGDTLTVGDTSASDATRNVGTGLAVTASGLSITATNISSACARSSCTVYGYQISNAGGTLVANVGTITARPITVTASTNTKAYDGTISAAATPTVTVGSLSSGDSARFSESYGSKNAGTDLTLTPTATVSDGNGGNNYAVTLVANITGMITPCPVTVVADDATKYTSGTVIFTGTEFTATGTLPNGGAVTSATLASAGAASGVPVGKYAIVPSAAVGLGPPNYSIIYQSGTLSVLPSIAGSILNTLPSSISGDQSDTGLTISVFGGMGLSGTIGPAGATLSTGSPFEEKANPKGS